MTTAFVLFDSGSPGAVQVGMSQAPGERAVGPDPATGC